MNAQRIILVVDDDLQSRQLTQGTLESAGYTVLLAEHGGQALQWVKTHHPVLIITEIVMQEHDGIELITKLRKLPAEHPRPKIIALCAGMQRMVCYLEAARHLGADKTLVRPVTSVQLLEEVERLLNVK
ncbi:MAG: response regulator [Rhodocyclaceae bacterium]|nr:response regulator [Rhodocyclaceae bacterium]